MTGLAVRAARPPCAEPRHDPPHYLKHNVGAVEVELTDDDLVGIDAELPEVAGGRYDEAGMASENL
jgi:hypothetical protein